MKTRTHHPSVRLLAPLAVAALSLGVAACSDDDGDPDDLDNPVDGVDDNLDDVDVDDDLDDDDVDDVITTEAP